MLLFLKVVLQKGYTKDLVAAATLLASPVAALQPFGWPEGARSTSMRGDNAFLSANTRVACRSGSGWKVRTGPCGQYDNLIAHNPENIL